MSDDSAGFENDPIDDELSAAMMVAAELVVHVKKIGLPELEFPIPDDAHVWVVNVRKLGIENGEESERPSHRPDRHDDALD